METTLFLLWRTNKNWLENWLNECLSAIFSLEKTSGFIFGLWLYDFRVLILRHKWFWATSYPMPLNKKHECKDHQIYSKKLRKICKKEVSSPFHQSHIKNSSFDQIFLYMVQTFLKLFWWRFLVLCSERLFISSATLSCMTCNTSTFSMLV